MIYCIVYLLGSFEGCDKATKISPMSNCHVLFHPLWINTVMQNHSSIFIWNPYLRFSHQVVMDDLGFVQWITIDWLFLFLFLPLFLVVAVVVACWERQSRLLYPQSKIPATPGGSLVVPVGPGSALRSLSCGTWLTQLSQEPIFVRCHNLGYLPLKQILLLVYSYQYSF